MEASLRLKPPFSLHRYRPEQRAGLSLLSLVALIAQIEFDRRGPRVVAQLSRPPSRPFRLRAGRLGLLTLILMVAAVQTVGARIMPGCFGNRGLSCRGTKSSSPSPSSGEPNELRYATTAPGQTGIRSCSSASNRVEERAGELYATNATEMEQRAEVRSRRTRSAIANGGFESAERWAKRRRGTSEWCVRFDDSGKTARIEPLQ
jgi:hypothetical protein